ncbi:predicted protein [Naegleria gruberi]|uniref:Predicted protein n=1 Tax=Naegleria gruberi TaxID=5762 RepID=D2VAY9_NAEGR|nr:uncharacterized protein NAEGRDRAFT_66027 [Naegleria gruberi]EFC46032.1 predicted protein [Naegleria gruberi]|eukprot:XP_002678776.1 predicted protein [Naegleria gruberi strain NEG-M]
MRRLSKLVGQLSISEEEEKPPQTLRQDVNPSSASSSINKHQRTIIFLGCGGSGKSSIMRAIHPIPEFLSLKLIDYMYENILNIPTFILGTDFGKELKKRKNQEFFENEFNHHSLMIYMAKTASIWDEEFAKKIYSMWWDPGFQKFVFERRSSFAYMDAVHYFIQQRNFKRIMRSGFHPCREDTFYCMIKTTGFVEISYRSGYVCVDSGGQRTERKKWPIHLQYEEGKVICFVVSLSEFDELCYEDDVTNRYEEGLSNWDTWYHNELVQKLPIYIIFNKMDVLERKVKNGIKFSDYVKSYDGDDNDPEAISEFIIQRYLEIDTFFNRVVKHFKISANNFDQCVNTINEIFHIDERYFGIHDFRRIVEHLLVGLKEMEQSRIQSSH